jgi:uncharacterized Zn finger protein
MKETENGEYKIVGSKGDEYTVTKPNTETSEWTCTCPHYFHRRVECKHIKEVKTKLEVV